MNEEECDECISNKCIPSTEDGTATNRSRKRMRKRQDAIKEAPPDKGDKVEINWKNKGSYFPAVITDVHPSGSYDVVYDDKSMEQHVDSDLISIVELARDKGKPLAAVETKKYIKQEMGKVFCKPGSSEPKYSRRQQLNISEKKCTGLPPSQPRACLPCLRSPEKEVPASSKMDVDQQVNGDKHTRQQQQSSHFNVNHDQQSNSHEYIASLPAKANEEGIERQHQQLHSRGHHSAADCSLDIKQRTAEKTELGCSNLEVVKKKTKGKYTGVTFSYGTWIARETWGLYTERKIIGRYNT